ncbi:hypothetical protein NDU88_001857 [Pleurodeles waltl]|uniref:Uncharacterized protein n=1 Tax=Pleurodeles waltl TaxID=8319 RepID=A0AAV7Q4C5_PLEWA|nr:hypothetical protein NDU88_001857 [Pleurodeles waltl]
MPSYQDASSALLEEWGTYILESSRGLVEILIKHAEIALDKIQNELKHLEQDLDSLTLTEEEKKIKNDLGLKVQQHEETVIARKQFKFQRDKQDYAEGKIFTFSRKFQSAKHGAQLDSPQSQRSENSSIESLSVHSDTSASEDGSATSYESNPTLLNEMRLALQQQSKDQQSSRRGKGQGRGERKTNAQEGDRAGIQRNTGAKPATLFKN